jgi:hypothetical protein
MLDQNNLTFKRPMFTYANASKKPCKIYFIYLGNKEIYCILRHAAHWRYQHCCVGVRIGL